MVIGPFSGQKQKNFLLHYAIFLFLTNINKYYYVISFSFGTKNEPLEIEIKNYIFYENT